MASSQQTIGQSMLEQIMPMIAMQSLSENSSSNEDSGSNKKKGRGGGGNKLVSLILLDIITKSTPFIGGLITQFFHRKMKERSTRLYDIMRTGDAAGSKKGSITLTRDINESKNNTDDTFDALLSYASDLPQARFIKRLPNGMYIIETASDISIGDSIFFRRVQNVTETQMVVEVFSYEKTIVQIRDFLTTIEEKWKRTRNNQLGRTIYYFDEIAPKANPTQDLRLNSTQIHIHFAMYPLYTNKSLVNVFGRPMQNVRRRINFFINNKAWYEEKGVPYTLGLLLHGDPGCGKTSLAKALAKDTNRHIINLKLSKNTTVRQLHNLFYSGSVAVMSETSNIVMYQIPIDKVIIMIEDIDCLTDIVIDRRKKYKSDQYEEEKQKGLAVEGAILIDELLKCDWSNSEGQKKLVTGLNLLKENNIKKMKKFNITNVSSSSESKIVNKDSDEKINLSTLLNVLDGILETPGRIIIMTTNHPEHLDSALIRPGRIDAIVHFTKSTRNDTVEMLESMCSIVIPEISKERIPDKVFTPAEVAQFIFENIECDVEEIIDKLVSSAEIKQQPIINEITKADIDNDDEEEDYETVVIDETNTPPNGNNSASKECMSRSDEKSQTTSSADNMSPSLKDIEKGGPVAANFYKSSYVSV